VGGLDHWLCKHCHRLEVGGLDHWLCKHCHRLEVGGLAGTDCTTRERHHRNSLASGAP
jgi:hypothetical protein